MRSFTFGRFMRSFFGAIVASGLMMLLSKQYPDKSGAVIALIVGCLGMLAGTALDRRRTH